MISSQAKRKRGIGSRSYPQQDAHDESPFETISLFVRGWNELILDSGRNTFTNAHCNAQRQTSSLNQKTSATTAMSNGMESVRSDQVKTSLVRIRSFPTNATQDKPKCLRKQSTLIHIPMRYEVIDDSVSVHISSTGQIDHQPPVTCTSDVQDTHCLNECWLMLLSLIFTIIFVLIVLILIGYLVT